MQSKRRRTEEAKAAVESDSDDAPLLSKSKARKPSTTLKKPPNTTAIAAADFSDSDVPINKKLAAVKTGIEKAAEKEAKAIRHDEEVASSSAQKKPKPKMTNGVKKANGIKKEELSDDDLPLSKKVKSAKVTDKTPQKKASKSVKPESTPEKKGKRKMKHADTEDVELEEGEEEYRWWEDPTRGDGTKKWTTLQHQGVIFPPPYEPLPKNVKMKYGGIPVTLEPEAEEVAGFFGSMLNSEHNVQNPTFQKNFFRDFQDVLKKTGGAKDKDGNKVSIKEFTKCDFTPIFNYYDAKREEKKALPAAEKKRLKAEKDELEAPYMYCLWDGRKQKVGNFRVEPPGLFRGRGDHPKTGTVKKRVEPEQITINIGKEATVPAPPAGHRWKEIKHDREGTWLAMWQENVNGNYKYVMLAANSDVKGQSDHKKFEKARELKKYIDRIRTDYTKDLQAKAMVDRQKATAMYLIDKLALRAGNEKGEDEAETVGCCSLKFENVTLKPPNIVVFDFLGKDSIRFYQEVEVDVQVFKNLKIFKREPKSDGDDIFDRLTTTQLNKHLSNYMPGLTAKVFRTYNASFTMSKLLQKLADEKEGQNLNDAEKLAEYNKCNRDVAILCNHKRTIGAAHTTQMEKMEERIKGLRYQKWRIKQMMLDIDSKIKKKKGAEYFELDDDLDEEWIKEHQAFLVEEQRTKITKKFEKENEKLRAEGQKEMKPKEVEERLEAAKELEAKFKKENKTKKVEAEGKGASVERYEANLEKLDQRIKTMQAQAQDKEENKEIALGTSKINYIDPRLTVVFSKKVSPAVTYAPWTLTNPLQFGLKIEKLFSKTLREKFDWAIKSVDEDWEF